MNIRQVGKRRCILHWAISALSPFFLAPPSPIWAGEPDAIFADGDGRLSVRLETLETSHIGAFDVHAAPALRHWLGGGRSRHGGKSGTRRDWWDIVFPNGAPNDLRWSWAPRPGFRLGVDWKPGGVWRVSGAPVEVSAMIMRDVNVVRVAAPSGLGIFYDPAHLILKADFWGVGARVAAPVMRGRWLGGQGSLKLGVGAFAYRSHTVFKATSSFLRLRFRSVRYRIRPMLSLEAAVSWSREGQGTSNALTIGIEGFPTDHFFTLAAKVGLIMNF